MAAKMSSSCRRLTFSHSQLSYQAASRRYQRGSSSSNAKLSAARLLNATQQAQRRYNVRRQFSSVHDVPTSNPLPSASHVQPHSHSADIASTSNKVPPPPPSPLSQPVKTSFGSPLPTGPARSPLDTALSATAPRMDWVREDIGAIYETPLMELAYSAVSILIYSTNA